MAKPALTAESAAALIPPGATLTTLRKIAARCTACDLYKRATQTVFGEGAADVRVVFVGEQPGHEEDLAGRPFVGPAGRLLDRALVEVGKTTKSASARKSVRPSDS